MPLVRRGPGLVRGVARTAVVAGTASAVSGRVQHRQQQRYAAQEQEQYAAQQEQYAAQQPVTPAAVTAPPPAEDPVEQLEKLAKLLEQGAISQEEYTVMKARVLSG